MNESNDAPLTFADVESAADRLADVAHRTPVMTSRTVNARVGGEVFFKCENFQRTGAFKFRGGYNAISRLSDEQRDRGVVTYSSGNHAQGIALAGRLLGVKTTIVMPTDALRVKLDATRDYGAEVVEHDPDETTREEVAQRIADQRGAEIIPPFDHQHIAAGQGTAGKELFEQVGELDALVVPIGGGGLISGCAVAAEAHSPGCRVIGVEPETADDAARSLREKRLVTIDPPATIADGARPSSLGPRVTFPTILRCVDEIVTVSDAQIIAATRFLLERLKVVVEPTGALAAAALFEDAVSPAGRIGAIISGGNADLSRMSDFLEQYA